MCFGHALSETAGWYNDMYAIVRIDNPWFVNGGLQNQNEYAGIFYKYYSSGYSRGDATTRVIIVDK